MKTWLVSYADTPFLSAQTRLLTSATRYGIEVLRPWGRPALERTSFYTRQKGLLDQPRGGGYWVWKPFVIDETLAEMARGDLLVYADAGIEIIGDLSPLLEISTMRAPSLLFAGHYDDVGAPGPNVCAKWTKRDCFVALGCDEPLYHDGQMVDASFMVLSNTDETRALIRNWLRACTEPGLVTDARNTCGLPDLPGFIEHRHDQSLLSLLAMRAGIELHRHPSQHGNHVKMDSVREPGEWTRHPYGSKGVYHNSPYRTLLHHHRGHVGPKNPQLVIERTIPAPREIVFRAWTSSELLKRWKLSGYSVAAAEADVRVGGRYRLELVGEATRQWLQLTGTYLEVVPPARLVYSATENTLVRVDFYDRAADCLVSLSQEPFASEVSRARHEIAWNGLFDTLVRAVATPSQAIVEPGISERSAHLSQERDVG